MTFMKPETSRRMMCPRRCYVVSTKQQVGVRARGKGKGSYPEGVCWRSTTRVLFKFFCNGFVLEGAVLSPRADDKNAWVKEKGRPALKDPSRDLILCNFSITSPGSLPLDPPCKTSSRSRGSRFLNTSEERTGEHIPETLPSYDIRITGIRNRPPLLPRLPASLCVLTCILIMRAVKIPNRPLT